MSEQGLAFVMVPVLALRAFPVSELGMVADLYALADAYGWKPFKASSRFLQARWGTSTRQVERVVATLAELDLLTISKPSAARAARTVKLTKPGRAERKTERISPHPAQVDEESGTPSGTPERKTERKTERIEPHEQRNGSRSGTPSGTQNGTKYQSRDQSQIYVSPETDQRSVAQTGGRQTQAFDFVLASWPDVNHHGALRRQVEVGLRALDQLDGDRGHLRDVATQPHRPGFRDLVHVTRYAVEDIGAQPHDGWLASIVEAWGHFDEVHP